METQALGPDCKIGDLEVNFHPGSVPGSVLFHGERRLQALEASPPDNQFRHHFMLLLGPLCIDFYRRLMASDLGFAITAVISGLLLK